MDMARPWGAGSGAGSTGRAEAALGDQDTLMLGNSLVQGSACSAPKPEPCAHKMF